MKNINMMQINKSYFSVRRKWKESINIQTNNFLTLNVPFKFRMIMIEILVYN